MFLGKLEVLPIAQGIPSRLRQYLGAAYVARVRTHNLPVRHWPRWLLLAYSGSMSNSPPPKPRLSAEMWVAVSAVLVGVCALLVSLYEAQLMRQEQRSAVLPILELSRSHYTRSDAAQTQWRLSMQVENVGIGPARIQDFRVTVDGQPHPTWASAIQALLRRDVAVNYGQSTINGRTVPADRMITMFDLDSTELTQEIVAEFDRLDFSACYCSVFDECWRASYSRFGVPEPVEACLASEQSFSE